MAFQGIHTMAGANRSATGYATAAELRMIMSGTFDPPTWAVLMLLADDDNTSGNLVVDRSFIRLMDNGDREMTNLFVFADFTRGSADDDIMVSQVTDLGPFNTAIRCLVGSTPLWLYGSTVGPTTFEMAWTGAVRNKGLNFNDATFTAGSNYNLLSYGDYGNEVQLSVTDYCFPIRFNITSINNPGTEKLYAHLYLNFAQSTEHQANLDVQAIGIGTVLTKNLRYYHGVDSYVTVDETLTITGGLYAAKFTVNLKTAKVCTVASMAALLAQVTGNGTEDGVAHSAVIEARLDTAADVNSILYLDLYAGTTAENGIYFGGQPTGYITNVMAFAYGSGVKGAHAGVSCDDAASDGCFKIVVQGTTYYVPFFSAAHAAGGW